MTTNEMTLNEYQRQAMTSCMDTCDAFPYMFINLVGEVGEFASKVAKSIRKGEIVVNDNLWFVGNMAVEDVQEREHLLSMELGDILWQLSGLCHVLGFSLEDVARQNLEKLADRQKRHVIDGNGDER